MKNLRIIATNETLENVDNAKAAAMIMAGTAVEVAAKYDVIGNRDELPVTNRDPKPAPSDAK